MAVSDYEYYGRVAFEGYRLYFNGVDEDGETRIPYWEELSEPQQRAWVTAGNSAVTAYKGE